MADHDEVYQETEEQAELRIQDFQSYCQALHDNLKEVLPLLPRMSSLTTIRVQVVCEDERHPIHDRVVMVFQTQDPTTGEHTNHVMATGQETFAQLVANCIIPTALGLDDRAFMFKPRPPD